MEDDNQYKSKTQKKKEAEKLQQLGLKLGQLSVAQLKRVDIPEKLKTALIDAKSITSNIAGRRHRQYIGVLMRDIDPESIQQALVEAKTDIPVEIDAMQEIKNRIDRLLADEASELAALLSEFPKLDRQRVRQLLRNIKKEKPGAKPCKSRRTLEQLILTELNSL